MERALSAHIDAAPLRPIHWLVIAIASIGLLFDGFDYQATAYAAPLIRAEWQLDPQTLGALISAGFAGLLIGSIVASYFADLVGRRKAFALCMIFYAVFTAAAALAPGFRSFVIMRFLTGLGLGGLIPIAVAWMLEFLPARRRAAIAAAVISLFLGGWLLASAAALFVIPDYGWRVFFFLGATPAILGVALVFWGPESPMWLLARNRRAEAEAVLRRINPAAQLPALGTIAPSRQKVNWLSLFSRHHLRSTIVIAAMYFLIATVSAGITQWLPTLLIDRGISMRNSYLYSTVVSIGPMIGTIVMGALLDRLGRRPTFILFWVGSAIFICLFAFASSPTWVMTLGFGLTFCAIASFSCLDVIAGENYPTPMRASAIGFGMGISRLGGMFGPMLGGTLVANHVSYTGFFLVFAIPPVLNVLLTFALNYVGESGHLPGAESEAVEAAEAG